MSASAVFALKELCAGSPGLADQTATAGQTTTADSAATNTQSWTVEKVYDDYFEFVWRQIRRFGVVPSAVDDAIQDVFLVVHRRLAEFEQRSSMKTWLFGIARRVASDYRKKYAKDHLPELPAQRDAVANDNPYANTERNQALRILHETLQSLEEEKREIFILAELEELPMPEIAAYLNLNLNTAYSRLRFARQDFEKALSRRQVMAKKELP